MKSIVFLLTILVLFSPCVFAMGERPPVPDNSDNTAIEDSIDNGITSEAEAAGSTDWQYEEDSQSGDTFDGY